MVDQQKIEWIVSDYATLGKKPSYRSLGEKYSLDDKTVKKLVLDNAGTIVEIISKKKYEERLNSVGEKVWWIRYKKEAKKKFQNDNLLNMRLQLIDHLRLKKTINAQEVFALNIIASLEHGFKIISFQKILKELCKPKKGL